MSKVDGPEDVQLLGMGALAPIGQTIQFIEAEANRVKVAITTWRASLEQRLEVRAVGAYPACLTSLEPLEWPWTRELIVDAGPWTLYMNNQKNGGDSSSCAGVISKMLEVRCVTVHQPRTPVGHASTQFWINRPGETPSQHRVLAAHAEDGRWEWEERGEVQPFEETEMYSARRVRDRLTRPMLIRYLDRLGLHPDDQSFFGEGMLIRELVTWPTNPESLSSVRNRLGLV